MEANTKRRRKLPGDQAAIEALLAWQRKRQAAIDRRQRILDEFYMVLKTSVVPLMESVKDFEVRGIGAKSNSALLEERLDRVPMPPSSVYHGPAPRPRPFPQNDAPPLHESLSFRGMGAPNGAYFHMAAPHSSSGSPFVMQGNSISNLEVCPLCPPASFTVQISVSYSVAAVRHFPIAQRRPPENWFRV